MTSTIPNLPTLIIVPGAYHTPAHYDLLTSALLSLQPSLKIHALALPSISRNPTTTRYDDIALIARTITACANNGEDIVLFMHSYGGAPGSEAVAGLSKKERHARGRSGGVIKLIYLAAMALDESFGPLLRGQRTPAPFVEEVDEHFFYTPASAAKEVYYNDVPSELAQEAVDKLECISQGAFTTPPAPIYAGWKHIPSTFIQCLQDQAVPMFWQEWIVKQEGGMFDQVVKMETGHSPFLSNPEGLAKIVVEAVMKAARSEDTDGAVPGV